MHQMLYLIRPGIVVVSLVMIGSFLMAFFRGRRIPHCFQCGACKVRISRPLGLLDEAASLLMIRTFRCTGCLTRFHAVKISSTIPSRS